MRIAEWWELGNFSYHEILENSGDYTCAEGGLPYQVVFENMSSGVRGSNTWSMVLLIILVTWFSWPVLFDIAPEEIWAKNFLFGVSQAYSSRSSSMSFYIINFYLVIILISIHPAGPSSLFSLCYGLNPEPCLQMSLRIVRRELPSPILTWTWQIEQGHSGFPDLQIICLKWGQMAAPIEAGIGFMSSSGWESEIFLSGRFGMTFIGF